MDTLSECVNHELVNSVSRCYRVDVHGISQLQGVRRVISKSEMLRQLDRIDYAAVSQDTFAIKSITAELRTMLDATEPCRECMGTGGFERMENCRRCNGTGKQ